VHKAPAIGPTFWDVRRRANPREVIVIAAVLGVCLAASISVAVAVPSSRSRPAFTHSHRQLAELDADTLVRAVELPKASRLVHGDALVAAVRRLGGPVTGAVSPFYVDRWELADVPVPANQLLNWVSDNPPHGYTSIGTASSTGPRFSIRADTFYFSPIGPLRWRFLEVAAVRVGPHECLVRVDALVTYNPEGSGEVYGRLETVGGPAPGAPRGIAGRVVFTEVFSGPSISVATAANGSFHVRLPVFLYSVSGRSPKVIVNGKQEKCERQLPIKVANHSVLRNVDVICALK
jgi:hypothetical protein